MNPRTGLTLSSNVKILKTLLKGGKDKTTHTTRPHNPKPDISGQSLCLNHLLLSPWEEEEWRQGKGILSAAEDRGEHLLGRSLKKGKDKEITKEKDKN